MKKFLRILETLLVVALVISLGINACSFLFEKAREAFSGENEPNVEISQTEEPQPTKRPTTEVVIRVQPGTTPVVQTETESESQTGNQTTTQFETQPEGQTGTTVVTPVPTQAATPENVTVVTPQPTPVVTPKPTPVVTQEPAPEETKAPLRKLSAAEIFNKDIVIAAKYVEHPGVMPYVLVKPSSVDDSVEMPVIVWLHGANDQWLSQEEFINKGPSEILLNWDLTNFNGYIVCPQMKGDFYSDSWCNEFTQNNLEDLLEDIMRKRNIDRDRIYVIGSGLGGQGAIYMAVNMSEYFSRAVVLSGYPSNVSCSDIKIPVKGFVGTERKGEDVQAINFMKQTFAPQVGEKNLTIIEASQFTLPREVFCRDGNNNGRSDMLEWLFSDK